MHFMYIGLLILISLSCNTKGNGDQQLNPVAPLPKELKECSGLVSLGDDLYVGTNDSGNPAELFVFSMKNIMKARTVKIKGATNHDWEELTADDQYVYISDTGNNLGSRTDLTIYRVNKEDLKTENEVEAERIFFVFSEQKKFDALRKHNFDCEAMISVGDSLYLFTKNRENFRTDLYSLSKLPGNYTAHHLDQFDAEGLITGADFRSANGKNELALVGYTNKKKGYHPFILYFSNVEGNNFFDGQVKRFKFGSKLQTETILFHDALNVFITNEAEHGDKGFVYQVDIQK